MPVVINKSGRIEVNPGQHPEPVPPFEYFYDPENRRLFLEALFLEEERYNRVVRLEFTCKGVEAFYATGLVGTVTDALLGIYQDSGPVMVSRRLLRSLGVSYEMYDNIRRSCDGGDDYHIIVARDRPRTVGDFLRSLFGREPGWSWWREK